MFAEIQGKLGFGFMRLPKEEDGSVDYDQTEEMVDLFLASGFNYFDTAWSYTGSEEALGRTLCRRHPRSSYLLATKLSAWRVQSREAAHAQLSTSLERTGAGYIDFYLLHNLGERRTRSFDDFGIWDFVQEKKAQGLIRHLGFSMHASPEELEAVLTAHPEVEFVQLQINYADWENPSVQARRCWEVARRFGKPVSIMEPVKGGLLARPPQSVQDIFTQAEPSGSAASWALRYAADLEGVMIVLSGMSTLAQMRDNIAVMQGFTGLTDAQRDVIARARDAFAGFPLIPCSSCDYCVKSCPAGISISGTFTAMNYLTLYEDMKAARYWRDWYCFVRARKQASECLKCGACMDVCPQHIAIPDELERCREALGPENTHAFR